MSDHNLTLDNSLNPNKDTNIYPFLKEIPRLNELTQQSISKLSERFNLNPETFIFLINITAKGVAYYYEN